MKLTKSIYIKSYNGIIFHKTSALNDFVTETIFSSPLGMEKLNYFFH